MQNTFEKINQYLAKILAITIQKYKKVLFKHLIDPKLMLMMIFHSLVKIEED